MLGQTLQEHIGDVSYLGPVSLRYLYGVGDRLNKVIGKLRGGRRYHYSISALVARLFAIIFSRKLQGQQYDLIFAPASYTEFAYLHTTLPIVYCCDSTITQLIDYYPGLSNLLSFSKREVTHIEQRAINRADLLIYSSNWAANSAICDFGAPAEKVTVAPFGANFPIVLPREEVVNHSMPSGRCKLLFVGVEWVRKGGEIAFETLVQLREKGVDAQLVICGCVPPAGFEHPDVTVIPFLDKNNPAQLDQLVQLYQEADFFLLPTRAECAAIAFCEASSFGLPSFTTDTGGIADFVENGVNGYRLSLEATGEEFACAIKKVLDDAALYQKLRITSRNLYEEKLNWKAWAQRVRQELVERGLMIN
jgi:glycosyltransferase involved in cell wall biosynthesis